MEKYLGVRYRYKEEQKNDTAEQQARMRNAAQRQDIATTEEVIGNIHADHPELAEELHQMVRAFRFGQLLKLLEGKKSSDDNKK